MTAEGERPPEEALDLLKLSLAEAQTSVRSYDTKAQIVGVGYIFALGVIGQFERALPTASTSEIAYVLLAWGIVIAPIVMFGAVLNPTRKAAPALQQQVGDAVKSVLYVDPKTVTSLAAMKNMALRADPALELSYELLKVSTLREVKRRRFRAGLFSSAGAFAVIFAMQLIRTL
ncbi:MAG: hypothetical protein AAF684_04505 [Pseudomonadota bacterium]